MRRLARTVAALAALLALSGGSLWSLGPAGAQERPVRLTGHDLAVEDVVRVARQDAPVEIAPEALDRADRAFRILLVAAAADLPVYGLNRGVGPARQVAVLKGDVIDPELRATSETFNRRLLIGHAQAAGPEEPREVVRAAMLARLNTALVGGAGLGPETLERFAAFLNLGITPVMRGRGSIGEADIYVMPPIGLAMMGIGEVTMHGARMPAAEALAQASLAPLRPWAKDALGLIGSNAFSAGQAALLCADAGRLLDRAEQVYASSLEALNGNVAPLLAASLATRPYPDTQAAAARMRALLAGSYLWTSDPERFLQDPLSFRSAPAILGVARGRLDRFRAALAIQLNAAEDNPVVLVDATPPPDASEVERRAYVSGISEGRRVTGAVVPSGHFDPLPWSLEVGALSEALAHLAASSLQRGARLAVPDFPKLAVDPPFTAMSMTADSLFAELSSLAGPVSTRVTPSSRDIEDIGTNAPLAVRRAGEIVGLARRVLAIEALVAGRLVELRRRARPDLALGPGTRALLDEFGPALVAPPAESRGGELMERADAILRR